jgi:hypothetical protein
VQTHALARRTEPKVRINGGKRRGLLPMQGDPWLTVGAVQRRVSCLDYSCEENPISDTRCNQLQLRRVAFTTAGINQ